MVNVKSLSLLIVLYVMLSLPSATAQNISVGGGVGYGSESNNLSFHGNLYYAFPHSPFRLGTQLGYSMRDKNSNRRTDRMTGNINGYLMAIDQPYFSLYGLTGVGLLHTRTKIKSANGSYTDTDLLVGANAGAGLEMGGGVGRYFAEGKYIFGREAISGFVFQTGVRIGL